MRNKNSSAWVFKRSLCVALAVVLLLSLAACGSKAQEPLRAPDAQNAAVATVAIETAYGTLAFPEELQDHLHHVEAIEGSIAMEVFYMTGQEGEKELFRIYFADAQAGTHVGYLTVDGLEIPVSYSICEYADEDFSAEEERQLYYSMMDAFTVVMNSIHDNPNFSQTRAVAPVGDQEAKLRYWKVTLPENVHFTETEENGNYQVTFYGEVSGERIDLYRIGLGEMESESTIGLYTVDGVQMPVVIQTYSLEAYDGWPEEERMVIYNMMASINTVIQSIVTDKNYSEAEAGA